MNLGQLSTVFSNKNIFSANITINKNVLSVSLNKNIIHLSDSNNYNLIDKQGRKYFI